MFAGERYRSVKDGQMIKKKIESYVTYKEDGTIGTCLKAISLRLKRISIQEEDEVGSADSDDDNDE